MRIGIIGSGMIGATVGRLWVAAGHEVRFGSRDPARIAELAGHMGATAGGQADAARFGEVVFTAAPYGLWPELARTIADAAAGKPLLDAANPYPERDGAFAQAALDARQGSGVPVAALLRSYYVRAFNSVYFKVLASEARRDGERIAIPLAGDDAASVELAAGLVRDAGFDPVVVGPLVDAACFDVGAPIYNNPVTAAEARRMLGLQPPG